MFAPIIEANDKYELCEFCVSSVCGAAVTSAAGFAAVSCPMADAVDDGLMPFSRSMSMPPKP